MPVDVSLDCDLESFFRNVLTDALGARSNAPSDPVQTYLIGVLIDAGRAGNAPGAIGGPPLALAYESALGASPAQRFEELRALGDRILLESGLFPDSLTRRGLDAKYAHELGSRSYRAASRFLLRNHEGAFPDVLLELASRFEEWSALLRDVSVTILAGAARSARDWQKLCEEWIRHRSSHLERLLRAQGIVVPSSFHLPS